MAGPYNFRKVLVWDSLPGGVVRLLRNGTVTVRDATGIAPTAAGTGPVLTTLTSDSDGAVTYTHPSIPTVDLVSPRGFVQRETSPDSFAEASTAAASAASSAASASSAATSAANSAALVGAPAGSAIDAYNAGGSRGAVNVIAAGAVGDGTTDDTASLQSAINTAATFGAAVYLPRGTFKVSKPSGLDYMLEAKPRMRMYGEGTIKVASTAGDFRAVITGVSTGTDLSDLTIEGITFDMNNTGNPATTTGSNGTLFTGNPRYAIYAAVGSRITVRRCTFKDIDSVNTVSIAGTAITDARVQDCKFYNVGQSNNAHDHSTIYTSSAGVTITGNEFVGVSGGKGATSAIETHGSDQVVADNRIRDYYTGMNITGVAANGSERISVHDNVIRGVNIGIDLWSQTTGPGLKHADIHDNLITIAHDAWIRGTTDYPRGIMLDPGINVDVYNLSIHHNTIIFEPVTVAAQAGELQAAGIALWINSITPKLHNLRVESNTITGSLSVGIRLQATVNGGRVQNNDITDPGKSADTGMASFYKAGLAVVGTFNDLLVENNRTFDTRGTHVITTGISTSITAATRCRARWNRTSCADGTSLQPWTATTGSGKAFLIDEEIDTYAAPGSCRVGSKMRNLATGDTYVQTTSPEGATWSVRAL